MCVMKKYHEAASHDTNYYCTNRNVIMTRNKYIGQVK